MNTPSRKAIELADVCPWSAKTIQKVLDLAPNATSKEIENFLDACMAAGIVPDSGAFKLLAKMCNPPPAIQDSLPTSVEGVSFAILGVCSCGKPATIRGKKLLSPTESTAEILLCQPCFNLWART